MARKALTNPNRVMTDNTWMTENGPIIGVSLIQNDDPAVIAILTTQTRPAMRCTMSLLRRRIATGPRTTESKAVATCS